MKKAVFVVIFVFFVAAFVQGEKEAKNKVIVFAFENRGGLELEQYSEMVPNSFYALLKDIPQYTSVPWDVLKSYLEKNGYKTGDLQNSATLIRIAKDFDATSIIRGQYLEKSGLFVVTFEVIDVSGSKVIYRSEKFGEGGIYVPDTLENVIAELVQDFTGLKIEFAYVDVKTDLACTLFLDNESIGPTPTRKRLLTGKHEIRIAYEKDGVKGDVLTRKIDLQKDEEQSFEIRVLVNVSITAELPCEVSIDTVHAGATPYTGKLLSGNEYVVKMEHVNENGKRETVSERTVSTVDEKDVSIDSKVTGSLRFVSGDIPFAGGITDYPFEPLPRTFESLPLGLYRAQCFLEDPKSGNRYCFYDSDLYLHPGEEKKVDVSSLEFRQKWEYLLVPSLPQFYDREPVKGGIVLGGFIGSLATTVVAFCWANALYNDEYLPMADAFNKSPLSSGYTQEEIDSSYGNIKTLVGVSICGLALTTGFYLYSIIDGGITMNRIHELFYAGKLSD